MGRRGKWLLALAVVGGAILLAWHTAHPWTDRAPGTPPHEPPPGRPFVRTPVSYAGDGPRAAALRARLKGTNVVIVVLDAARADHFSGYGYPRETTPSCDRVAKEGIAFEQHFCTAPVTRSSTASLFTGLDPDTHGLLLNESPDPLPAGTPTLAQAFAGAGYATYLISSHEVASPEFGLGADFQHWRAPRVSGTGGELDRVAWLQGELRRVLPQWQARGAHFFAYLHVLPPHYPYRAPPEFARLFQGRPPRYWQGRPMPGIERGAVSPHAPASGQEWVNRYDANLRWADSFVGDLEETLARAGLLDRTLLIVTADHGEALLEHGYSFHPASPYDETLHIPLLMRFPGDGRPVGRVHALTQTIDLFPTLVDLYQLPGPGTRVQGVSLLPLLTGEAQAAHDYMVSRAGGMTPCYVVRDARATLLVRPGRTPRRLYDMDRDPWQTRDVYAEQGAHAAALERAFAAYLRDQRWPPEGFPESPGGRAKGWPPGRLSGKQRKALNSLGYVE